MMSAAPTMMRGPVGRHAWSRRCAAGWLVAGVAAVATAGAGCSEEPSALPPARPAGAATTSGAGGTGGGTAGPDAGVDAGPGPANLCECVAAYGGTDGPCADCFNQQTAADAPCDARRAGCAGDPDCIAISVCLKACGRDLICQRACAFPEDAGAAHRTFQRVLSCVCAACGATCAYGAPVECVEIDAGGGAGGAGGGAGGAGGGGAPGR